MASLSEKIDVKNNFSPADNRTRDSADRRVQSGSYPLRRACPRARNIDFPGVAFISTFSLNRPSLLIVLIR